jgi:hypothetical protein
MVLWEAAVVVAPAVSVSLILERKEASVLTLPNIADGPLGGILAGPLGGAKLGPGPKPGPGGGP